ncbi:pleckstrin homology domain-containing family G member 1-like [Dysidea avara]|uniref:pleckstrin homology domain-containing family G member 1-like n=1 Tax=Dysidea avara TaxID=196820 RepID=UPI00331A056D
MTNFFKKCQQKLGHMLPLGAYLLKPAQRVLKYSLLLEKINDCLSAGEDGKEDIIAAIETMSKVGEQINETKKKYEATVKLQEIQAQLDGWDGNDLITYGDSGPPQDHYMLGEQSHQMRRHFIAELTRQPPPATSLILRVAACYVMRRHILIYQMLLEMIRQMQHVPARLWQYQFTGLGPSPSIP